MTHSHEHRLPCSADPACTDTACTDSACTGGAGSDAAGAWSADGAGARSADGAAATGRFAIAVEDARGDGSAPIRLDHEPGGWQRLWRGTMAVVRGVSGLDKYERYLNHQRRTHPDEAPLTEAEFWRQTWEREERHPTARCC